MNPVTTSKEPLLYLFRSGSLVLVQKPFHTIGQLWDTKTQQILSNDIEIHFVEIPKLVKQWREEKVNSWENMSHDSSFRLAYEAREKLLLDEQAKLAHAEQKGIEKGRKEGLEKGVEQGKMQMIRGMHEIGVPLETIAKASKLSVGEVERILKLK